MKIKRTKLKRTKLKGLPLMAIGVISAVSALAPIITPLASAAGSDVANQTVQVAIGSKVEVSVDNARLESNMATNSLSENTAAVKNALRSNVTVKSNVSTGYSLNIKAGASGVNMVPPSNLASVSPIPAITGKALTAGTPGWGYKVGNEADWHGVTTADRSIKHSDTITPSTGDMVSVQFGVATAANQTATTYTGSVVYSVAVDATGGRSTDTTV